MTTIVATPQPTTASVALTITPTASVTQILRTDANGIHPVRTQAGQLPTSAPFVVIDNEASVSGPITYTVVSTAGAAVTTSLDLTTEWLTVPVTPAVSQPVLMVTGLAPQRTARSTVHEVIDRADPVVTLAPLGLRAGTLEFLCYTYADAQALETVYASGEVVQLRQSVPGVDMYHIATSTSVVMATETPRWLLSVAFVEVAWPMGDQVGTLGWSVDDVTATYATVAAVALAYATVNDLTIGPV